MECRVEEIKVEVVDQTVEKIVDREVLREIEKVVPYVQTEIKEVHLVEEKPVHTASEVEKVCEIDRYIEKLVIVRDIVDRPVEIERFVDRVIEIPRPIELCVEKVVIADQLKLVDVIQQLPIEIALIT